jgi:hypothetical protein
MGQVKRCPVCLIENTGGRPHTWHKTAHKKKGYSSERIAEMVRQTIEQNQVKEIICDAVDLARQPDGWRSKPKKSRKEYHQVYYWRHADKRRMQRRESKTLRRRVRPLIAELCKAVDLGRITAGW